MPAFICTACGTQYAPSEAPPPHCTICEDDRQYVPPGGQAWTTLEKLAAGHFNAYRQYEPGVIGIGAQPHFAIGQRALLLLTPHGNVLWDTIAMLDAATITLVRGLGGLKAIGISHPHFYTTGHFPGGSVLHWAGHGRGVLCSSDIATVTMDRKFLSFMHSYPNLIPLSAKQVTGIGAALAPFEFDTIYGHYFDRVIATGGKRILEVSVERYLAAIGPAGGQ